MKTTVLLEPASATLMLLESIYEHAFLFRSANQAFCIPFQARHYGTLNTATPSSQSLSLRDTQTRRCEARHYGTRNPVVTTDSTPKSIPSTALQIPHRCWQASWYACPPTKQTKARAQKVSNTFCSLHSYAASKGKSTKSFKHLLFPLPCTQ
jgi:hypothetical protein